VIAMTWSRRRFCRATLESLAGYALCELVLARPLWAKSIERPVERWARELQEQCADLRRGALTQAEWRVGLARLYARLPLVDLLAAIDFERVAAATALPDDDATTARVALPRIEGLPERRAFAQKLFGMRKGRAIAPHGHENMVSAHLVVRGRVRVRQYDRVRDEERHLVLRPSRDEVQGPGGHTSISDRTENVHWLVAEAEPSFTFDVVVDGLDPTLPYPYRQAFVDPDRAERLADGTLRVPRLGVEAAIAKYGRHS
jgi:PCO_ADO